MIKYILDIIHDGIVWINPFNYYDKSSILARKILKEINSDNHI